WPGLEATELVGGELAPLCSPRIARQLRRPADLARLPLLRSYRSDEWPRWFAAADTEAVAATGPVFDSSIAMVAAAERSLGVALAPPVMFAPELASRRLAQPFDVTVSVGAYFLTRPRARAFGEPAQAFLAWCSNEARAPAP
ncbi:MAG TPA: LysR substrate-binding domain-containing protein, partial [Caulobacteraceae bacterium]|nr:LysR substrate-binding domain-containing protein [Caulobacteraceae bacterium]